MYRNVPEGQRQTPVYMRGLPGCTLWATTHRRRKRREKRYTHRYRVSNSRRKRGGGGGTGGGGVGCNGAIIVVGGNQRLGNQNSITLQAQVER
jgi:hypothetical protein